MSLANVLDELTAKMKSKRDGDMVPNPKFVIDGTGQPKVTVRTARTYISAYKKQERLIQAQIPGVKRGKQASNRTIVDDDDEENNQIAKRHASIKLPVADDDDEYDNYLYKFATPKKKWTSEREHVEDMYQKTKGSLRKTQTNDKSRPVLQGQYDQPLRIVPLSLQKKEIETSPEELLKFYQDMTAFELEEEMRFNKIPAVIEKDVRQLYRAKKIQEEKEADQRRKSEAAQNPDGSWNPLTAPGVGEDFDDIQSNSKRKNKQIANKYYTNTQKDLALDPELDNPIYLQRYEDEQSRFRQAKTVNQITAKARRDDASKIEASNRLGQKAARQRLGQTDNVNPYSRSTKLEASSRYNGYKDRRAAASKVQHMDNVSLSGYENAAPAIKNQADDVLNMMFR